MAELIDTSLYTDSSLRAYYRMESGALTTDSKNSYTLTNVGTVTDGTGKYGGAGDLGVSNSSKAFYRNQSLGITNKVISMSCWVKLNTEISGGNYSFVQQGNDTTDTFFGLEYEYNSGTRRINGYSYKVGGGDVKTNESFNVTMGTSDWYHLVYTSDGTTQKLYVNGSEKDSGSVVANGSFSFENKFNIGRNQFSSIGSGPNQYASALIDDVAVFSKELSSTEVSELYSDGGFTPRVMIF